MSITRRLFVSGLCASPFCGVTAKADVPPIVLDGSTRMICGLRNPPNYKYIENLRKPRPEATRVIHSIANLIGVRPLFEVVEADFKRDYVALAALHDDKRYVIYDAKWFKFEANVVGWYMVWVIAHEIGHHLYGHPYHPWPDNHRRELDADRFSGWAVARLGGRLEQALSFMPSLTEQDTESHPGRNRRMEATREGWVAGSVENHRR